MFELALAGALALLLTGTAALLFWIPWGWLLAAGVILSALGLIVGVPTGLLYHVRLRATLAHAGALPARWWVHPTRLHERIGQPRRGHVLRPFYAGAAGFVAIIVGCGLAVVGLLRSPWGL